MEWTAGEHTRRYHRQEHIRKQLGHGMILPDPNLRNTVLGRTRRHALEEISLDTKKTIL